MTLVAELSAIVSFLMKPWELGQRAFEVDESRNYSTGESEPHDTKIAVCVKLSLYAVASAGVPLVD